jgi:hypothetical protein
MLARGHRQPQPRRNRENRYAILAIKRDKSADVTSDFDKSGAGMHDLCTIPHGSVIAAFTE